MRPYSVGRGGGEPHSTRSRQALAQLEATVPLATLPLRDGRQLRGLGGGTWLVAATAYPDALLPLQGPPAPTWPTGQQLRARRLALGWTRERLRKAAACGWGALRRLENEDRGGAKLRERIADVLATAETTGEERIA